MAGTEERGNVITCIPPLKGDVARYRLLKMVLPLAFVLAFAYLIYAAFQTYGISIPLEFFPVMIVVALIYLLLSLFAMMAYVRYAYPVEVYANGLEFRTTSLGARLGRPGFIHKRDIEEIAIFKVGKQNEKVGMSIFMKGGRSAWIGDRDPAEMHEVIVVLKSNFRGLVQEKGSISKK
ncbi:MAG: hypothetical protein A4E32_01364 [Methanomassiliicoccales archaeon PtaU1.Bin124]|nr:MAG: hypothetical protein A4E32_01364 [Methanomassiliicoccales archaeon PtaU1.Bin124]